jgi:hypothetical protein
VKVAELRVWKRRGAVLRVPGPGHILSHHPFKCVVLVLEDDPASEVVRVQNIARDDSNPHWMKREVLEARYPKPDAKRETEIWFELLNPSGGNADDAQ